MKTIYTTLIAALIGVSAFSQSMLAPRGGHHPQNPVTRTGHPSTQTNLAFYCDYGFMDENYQTVTQSLPAYTRYIWDMSMNYKYTNGDTSLHYAAVGFGSLYNTDYAGAYPFAAVASNSYSTLKIDTIFFNAGHSNYSGQNDTILVQIIQETSGYPNPNATVLHCDTIITNVSLTGSNTWLTNGTFYVNPNYTINNNTTKFAVRVEYFGAHADTFGMTAGFGDLGAGNCTANPTLPNFAVKSKYFPNSYRQDMRFQLPPNNIAQLPTSSGADVYYECDGVAGYTAGGDSEGFLQNWDLWIHAEADPLGIDEANGSIGVGQNVPNPSTGETQIPYTLKNSSNVTLTIFDIAGNQVSTQSENASAGQHSFNVATSNLAAGVYFYKVATTEGSVTRKMIVQ